MTRNCVLLYLYDLAEINKWNKALSFSAFVANSSNVIPHLTIVVFGREYFYGESGIATFLIPGKIAISKEIVQIGMTNKTSLELEEWLHMKIASDEYLASKYSLLSHNCITFANALSLFLCDKALDEKYFETQKRADGIVSRFTGTCDIVRNSMQWMWRKVNPEETRSTERSIEDPRISLEMQTSR